VVGCGQRGGTTLSLVFMNAPLPHLVGHWEAPRPWAGVILPCSSAVAVPRHPRLAAGVSEQSMFSVRKCRVHPATDPTSERSAVARSPWRFSPRLIVAYGVQSAVLFAGVMALLESSPTKNDMRARPGAEARL